MRIGVASDLRPEIAYDAATKQPVFRVFLPDSFDNFDPDVPWFVFVTGCPTGECVGDATLQWRVDTAGRSLTHGHRRTPTVPDEFVIRYGESLPGWAIAAPARALIGGACYFVTIRIDNRAAKAAFIIEGDSVRYGQHGTPPGDPSECASIVDSGESSRAVTRP